VGEPTWIDELHDRAVRDELDRRHPKRLALRPSDVAGVLAGFDAIDAMWAPTIARAHALPSSILHQRVNGEYSFVETLRHLLFATDAWLMRVALRVSDGYHEWGVPPDLPPDAPPDTGPDLEPVLEVRAGQHAAVRAHLAHTSGGTTGSPSATSPSSSALSDHAARGAPAAWCDRWGRVGPPTSAPCGWERSRHPGLSEVTASVPDAPDSANGAPPRQGRPRRDRRASGGR
jgi:DinB superfamily